MGGAKNQYSVKEKHAMKTRVAVAWNAGRGCTHDPGIDQADWRQYDASELMQNAPHNA